MANRTKLRGATGLAVITVYLGTIVASASASAQATSASPERADAASHQLPHSRVTDGAPGLLAYVQVVNERNGECLMGMSWYPGRQVQTLPCDGSSKQMWNLRPVGNGHYEFVNSYSGMCLDVANESTNDWTHVVQWSCVGAANQRWRLAHVVDGWYELLAQHSNKCLDISWGYAVQYGCNGQANQRFRFR